MNVNRQAARSASTRAKLIQAARTLFARSGYAEVATEEIVRRAGVTRGALYHQFPTKEDLFLAVYEQVEQELTESVSGLLGVQASPFAALRAGIRVFLEACRAPDVQRIVLIDGPAVLGWERWREVAARYGLGLMEAAISAAIEAGEIEPLAAGPLAHLLMGALDEAALLVVRDPDATDAVAVTFERLLDGLRSDASRGTAGASGA
jgi:AcrR family transcriptional regulator